MRALRRPGTAAVAAGLLAMAGCASAAPAPAAPPNVVLIVADDLGWADIGPYGQEKILTPSLDRMAREGTRFDAFYAGSTVCAPSRSVLMTGKHTGRTFLRSNPSQVVEELRLPRGVDFPVPDSVTTLAEVLQRAGYATGGFGKWGLGSAGSSGDPLRQGFDTFFGHLSHVEAHHYYPPHLWDDSRKLPLPGNRGSEGPSFSHDLIADRAIEFIDRHAGEPFFLYVPFTIPHAELRVPEDALAGYRGRFPETPYVNAEADRYTPAPPFARTGYRSQAAPRAAFAAMIGRMDRDIGRLMSTLQRLGADGRTLVIFTSDNGPHREGGADPAFFDSGGPLRGIKRDLYEGGIRVPMIAAGPGVPAGATSAHVWAHWDLLPTLADIAGAKAPTGLDGLSMRAALEGGRAPSHEFLYWEFHERGFQQAVRTGKWKAVRLKKDAPLELYDLDADAGETRDVAAAHPDVVGRIERYLRTARTESGRWATPN